MCVAVRLWRSLAARESHNLKVMGPIPISRKSYFLWFLNAMPSVEKENIWHEARLYESQANLA